MSEPKSIWSYAVYTVNEDSGEPDEQISQWEPVGMAEELAGRLNGSVSEYRVVGYTT